MPNEDNFDWDAVDKLTIEYMNEEKKSIEKPKFNINESEMDSFLYPYSSELGVRAYQKNISRTCLFKNTLVSLPTGLGKTFIAGVIMLNYMRWFPNSLIIFMAPTKPLVVQQHEACCKFLRLKNCQGTFAALNQINNNSVILTGALKKEKRQLLWKSKKVFYCTPQTVESDLDLFDMEKVSLIVVDEAHRAMKKFSYVTVVRSIQEVNPWLRVLALSATPGNDFHKVKEVVQNLSISGIEFRDEKEADVKPYVYDKKVEIVEVETTSKYLKFEKQFSVVVKGMLDRMNLFLKHKKADNLVHLLPFSLKTLNWSRLDTFLKAFQSTNTKALGINRRQKQQMWCEITTLQSLAAAFKSVRTTGLECFESIINTKFNIAHPNFPLFNKVKINLINSESWKELVSIYKSEEESVNNPKLIKLCQILNEHFARYKLLNKDGRTDTSVIIFSEKRDSVEIVTSFIRDHTDLAVQKFVGQASGALPQSGMSQKEQQHILEKFRSGRINVLVCTCIGEEGLDIGSVDLIVCFNSTSSPSRMIQRFGRAGRKRQGKVILLLSKAENKGTFFSGKRSMNKLKGLLKEGQHLLEMKIPTIRDNIFLYLGKNYADIECSLQEIRICHQDIRNCFVGKKRSLSPKATPVRLTTEKVGTTLSIGKSSTFTLSTKSSLQPLKRLRRKNVHINDFVPRKLEFSEEIKETRSGSMKSMLLDDVCVEGCYSSDEETASIALADQGISSFVDDRSFTELTQESNGLDCGMTNSPSLYRRKMQENNSPTPVLLKRARRSGKERSTVSAQLKKTPEPFNTSNQEIIDLS
eukprot:augustus_masked-scaffold_2-processed-gene-2.27-mRNA-1 protein AED:0.23 eAED:0.24 QI:0/-1/0/1/-1/1/1/0/807